MVAVMKIVLVLCALILQVYSRIADDKLRTENDTSVEYDINDQSRERFLFGTSLLKSKCRAAVDKPSNVLSSVPVTLTRLSNNKLYFFSPTAPATILLNFDQAVQYCIDHGMHLVTVNSAEENFLLYTEGAALGLITVAPALWIGHRDITGTNNFQPIQPKVGNTPTFFSAVPPVTGECVAYRDNAGAGGSALSWVTRPCTARRGFICEMELPCSLFL